MYCFYIRFELRDIDSKCLDCGLNVMTDKFVYRWSYRRKYELLRSIIVGDVSAEIARERYGLTSEELKSWIAAADKGALHLKCSSLNDRRRARAAHSDGI